MSDEEWQRWMATYAKEGRPIPPVMGRARTDRRRALIGVTGVYALGGLLVLLELPELRHAHTIGAFASWLLAPLCVLIIIVGLHAATWGILGQSGGAPLDLMTDLELRHARRRRLIRLLPWLTGLCVSATIAEAVISMVAAGRFDLPAALAALGACAATAGIVWLTMRRVGKVIDRELRQSAEARRLLTDDDDPSRHQKAGA
jgi:hypothetical protein